MNSTYMPVIIMSLTFLVSFLLAVGVWQLIKAYIRRKETIDKIKLGRDHWQATFDEEKPSLAKRIISVFSKSGAKYSDDHSSQYPVTRLKLLRAGIQSHRAVSIFWGVKIWMGFILAIGFLLLLFLVFKAFTAQMTMFLTVFAGIVGFYGPDLFLLIKASNRRAKIVEGLPDALDLLVICVEAGLGVDSAFNRVAEEIKATNPVLSKEFKMLNLELRAGLSRREALRNLSRRTNVENLNSLVTLLVQTDKFGTSVARSLRVFAKYFRTMRFQKAEEIAAKLPVKMVFPLVLFIFPSFLTVLIGPSLIEVYEKFIK